MTDDGLRGVAYHEAGHAVVALALDLRVARVEIFHENNSGETDAENADHLPIEDRIAICVAGIQANKMFKVPIHHSERFERGRCFGRPYVILVPFPKNNCVLHTRYPAFLQLVDGLRQQRDG